jgi:hypothetical protein
MDHGLVFFSCKVSRPVRVMTIHSPQDVLIIFQELTFNFLNYLAFPCFSRFADSMTFSNICSLLISLEGACVTSPSSFPCYLPWSWGNHKVIISAWAIAGGIITWCPSACRSIDWHLHMIAYELLEKPLMCKRWIEPKRKNWNGDTQSNIVWSDQTLSGWESRTNS